jgi:hypothetical protein
MVHNQIVKELATLAMKLQSIQERPHLPYHSAKHPYIFFESVLAALMYLHQQGIVAEMGITEEEFFAIYFAMVFISLFHDNSFELTSQGFPDPQNEEASFVSTVPFIKSTFGDLVSTDHVHIGMTHTKVGFDPVSGLVSSPIYTGTVVKQLIQLLSELGDKVHLFDLNRIQTIDQMFKAGFEDNLRLVLEIELRTNPALHGDVQGCIEFLKSIIERSDVLVIEDHCLVFDKVTKMMCGFFRVSVIDHINSKLIGTELAQLPALMAMVDEIFTQYEDLIDFTGYAQLIWTAQRKSDFIKVTIGNILAEYYQ